MADNVPGSFERPNTLAVGILSEDPVDAADVGKLIVDMAADYRRATRGRLVLAGYENGSAWIIVQDAIAAAGGVAGSFSSIAAAAGHMKTYVEYLRGQLKPKEVAPLTVDQSASVAKSATRMVETAAKHGAGLDLRYTSDVTKGKHALQIRLTPPQVRETKSEMSLRRQKDISRMKYTAIAPPSHEDNAEVERAVKMLSGPRSQDELEGIVALIAAVLKKAGNSRLLPTIAAAFDEKGRRVIGDMVRSHFETGI
ncbi:hypothetical protein [Mesorhizobium sp. LNJC405B00]|uniref:hypothetical protein n=1 Tax=Mesorhizobium sp. LNJC405B00 TaxID=1287281 RepID=UPI0003CE3B82|nr:hypothetical protein [Mesorhizobium sp. LNJC405B00]ESX87092.1 hypothetical protein X755_29340 [Mesorhizobium sp. LNJC405B00]